jgi:PAS domain S-box-containing protein
MAQVLRTGVPVRGAEVRVERPDGTSVWAVVHIEPVRDDDGHVVGAINCFHETPDSALERERRLAATYENAGIGMAELDAEGKLLRVNGHLRNLIGYPERELLGRSIFDFTHPDEAVADKEKYRQQVAGETEGYTIEKRFRRHDGSHVWVNVTSRSVRDAEGNFLYAVRVQQDVSARKQSEEIFNRFSSQQAALHDLVAKLQHAVVVDDVYTAAMDAMSAALRCDRASVLVFDKSNVMRFVASHGLSEAYRKAVDGHSPWSADTRNARPVCIEDVAKSDLSDELKRVVSQEGIAALAFIPLQDGERLIGKFMIYYNVPHAFGEREIVVAATIAHHVGFSLGRLRTQTAALQLAAIVDSSGRHCQQGSRWHDQDVEPGGRAIVWLYRGRSSRQTRHPDHPPGPSRRRAPDFGANSQRRTRGALRDRAPPQGWQSDRYFPDDLADQGHFGQCDRSFQDRARHH